MDRTPPPDWPRFPGSGTEVPPAAFTGSAATLPPPLPGAQPPAADIVPPGGVLYKVDSSRASFGELWRDTRGPSVLITWISKLLRARLPGSVNDPNVESLRPFEVPFSSLPADVAARIGPMLRECSFVGFDGSRPVCHAIVDLFNNSRCYTVALSRADGRAVARVVLRMEGARVPPKTHFYCDMLSELSDGTFVWSTAAKASLDAPPGFRMQRHPGASPGQLWAAHENALRGLGVALRVCPAIMADQVLDLLDRHHAQVRDFHLSRRLFVPMSDAERSDTSALGVAYNAGAASGFAYPEVLTEMERLQSKKTSWVSGLVILGVSLLLFIAAGTRSGAGDDNQRFSRELLLLLIPILLFHELGHYLAMRIFRYRNVRMFFIPFFGAAVSGTNYNAPGWKKAIVALMGPVPGIVLGAGLGIAGIVLHHDLLIKAALLLLILNGSNLLPVLPLDGGRIVQTLLFSRHYAADIIFRAAAAAALIGIAALGGGRFFLILGIAMLLGIPLAWRLGRIAAELKRNGLTPPPTNDHRIPPHVAQAIITRLKSTPGKGTGQNNKILAQHALTVYETLCTRPPGWLATAAFAVVHLGSVVIALVLAIALLMAQGGPLGNFFRQAANQPRSRIASSEIVSYPAAAESSNQTGEHKTIVANFPSVAVASSAFDAIGPKLAAGESLERFGQTLFICFPADDDSAGRRWIADVEARTRDFCVNTGQFGDASLRLVCLAPTADAARDLQEQAEEYLNVPAQLHLLPPWSPQALQNSAQWSGYRTARRTYLRLSRAGRDGYTDPRVTSLNKQANEAYRRGDKAESDRIRNQQSKLIQDIRQQEIRKIAGATDGSVDPVVVANYLKIEEAINVPDDDDDPDDAGAPRVGFDSPQYQAMAARMGQVPLSAGKPAPQAERYSTQTGGVSRTSLLITFNFMNFNEPADGAPALVKWLESHGCKSMKYEFRTGALSGNPFD